MPVGMPFEPIRNRPATHPCIGSPDVENEWDLRTVDGRVHYGESAVWMNPDRNRDAVRVQRSRRGQRERRGLGIDRDLELVEHARRKNCLDLARLEEKREKVLAVQAAWSIRDRVAVDGHGKPSRLEGKVTSLVEAELAIEPFRQDWCRSTHVGPMRESSVRCRQAGRKSARRASAPRRGPSAASRPGSMHHPRPNSTETLPAIEGGASQPARPAVNAMISSRAALQKGNLVFGMTAQVSDPDGGSNRAIAPMERGQPVRRSAFSASSGWYSRRSPG